MKTYPSHHRNSPVTSWIGAGIGLLIAGLLMIPLNVVTPVGIGLIVGGVSLIGAAFVRPGSSD